MNNITAADFNLPEDEGELILIFPPNKNNDSFPSSKRVGWYCYETIGIGVVNPRSVIVARKND